jgi:hypothetical protein
MRYTTQLMLALAGVCQLSCSAATTAVQTPGSPAIAASDNRLSTLDGFTVDYPKNDWNLLGGAGSALVVFAHKDRQVTVAIERNKIALPLAPDEITDQTATLEIEEWQARRPAASGFTHQFMDNAGVRLIVIDFTQPGPQGAEHVRMYTLPRGSDWYRVICTFTRGTFDRYRDTCHRIALSVHPTETE